MGHSDISRSVIQYTAYANDVTLIQDNDHASKDLQTTIFSRDTVDSLKNGGVKNLCLEYGKEHQPAISTLNNVGKDYLANRDKLTPEKQNELDSKIEGVKDKYVEHMKSTTKIMGVEKGSKDEEAIFKAEADTIIYAGSKGIKCHAVDTGVSARDGDKRMNSDGQLADNVAKVAETGKTAVVIGAGHGNDRDKEGLDEHLADKGLKVGKIDMVDNKSNPVFKDRGSYAKEVPTTLIETDSNRIIPGDQVKVSQVSTDGKLTTAGSEIATDGQEAANSKYQKVSEKDLGNIMPPEVFNKAPKAEVVENSR